MGLIAATTSQAAHLPILSEAPELLEPTGEALGGAAHAVAGKCGILALAARRSYRVCRQGRIERVFEPLAWMSVISSAMASEEASGLKGRRDPLIGS
jgi:hypothetical protein